MKLYLFRHGETNYNKYGIFTGWKDASLTKKGVEDALKIRKQLRDEYIDLAITSDLKRAKQTLKIALEGKNITVIIARELRERDYGYLSGKNKLKLKKEKPLLYELYHRSAIISPPAGENFNMVMQRVEVFLKKLLKNHKNKAIAISAHGNSIRAILGIVNKLKREEIEKIEVEFGRVYYLSLDTL